jgi:hypothetical protein
MAKKRGSISSRQRKKGVSPSSRIRFLPSAEGKNKIERFILIFYKNIKFKKIKNNR